MYVYVYVYLCEGVCVSSRFSWLVHSRDGLHECLIFVLDVT